jgi:diaminopimelate decarboxylase
VDRVLALIQRLRVGRFNIRHADLGGGLGVAYKPGEVTPSIEGFVADLKKRLEGRDLHAVLEPGRSIVAAAGVLLTKALYRKKTGEKEFVIVDAAMNDLIRPALYGAYHEILPVRQNNNRRIHADLVGPVCETGDFLARDRDMPDAMPGDVLAISTCGAYGFAQASTYNARRRPAEVMVSGEQWRVVRERESYQDLIRGETL